MATAQTVIDDARDTLNDAVSGATPRYSDTRLLRYVNDGVVELYGMCPHLRFGNYSDPILSLNLSDVIPFDGRERIALHHYVVARAEFADDQHVSSGRAQGALVLTKQLAMGQ